MFISIIDEDVIEEYERDTGKQWREDVEERMAKICSFFDFGFAWNKDGNIVINEGFYEDKCMEYYKFFGKDFSIDIGDETFRHYEYVSAEKMIEEWMDDCRNFNEEFAEKGLKKPFKWI